MATTASTQASTRASALLGLLHAAAAGDGDTMTNLVTEDVVGWSPNLFVTSRGALLAAMEPRDDTFSGIEVRIAALDQIGDKAIAEWRLAVDHTGPLVVDDTVIEPTGRRLHLSGATVAEFDGDRVCGFRSYFDDLALIEQVLVEQ